MCSLVSWAVHLFMYFVMKNIWRTVNNNIYTIYTETGWKTNGDAIEINKSTSIGTPRTTKFGQDLSTYVLYSFYHTTQEPNIIKTPACPSKNHCEDDAEGEAQTQSTNNIADNHRIQSTQLSSKTVKDDICIYACLLIFS